MSDLIFRAQKAKTLSNDPSLKMSLRLSRCMRAFAGLEISEIPEETWNQLEESIFNVNQILAPYPLKTDEDYQLISEADLQRMLSLLDSASSQAIVAELDRIVSELDDGVQKLPVKAIHETREHRDLMIPRLIEVVGGATSSARKGDVPEGNAHFFAVFLLTEFRAEEAFSTILEAFSLPGELPFDLFGDAVTSTLARVLAQFSSARPDLVDDLISNRELNQYVRWEAANYYVHLVRDGLICRDEAVRRLQIQLRRAIDSEDEPAIGGLICTLVSFAPEETLEDIQEAYARDLVDRGLVDMGTVEQSVAEGDSRVRKALEWCQTTGIDDTIEELRTWAGFQEEPRRRRVPPPHLSSIIKSDVLTAATAPQGSSRIGRNVPCPCGSGKKYKKCCQSPK